VKEKDVFKYHPPLALGLGVSFSTDAFGVKLRTMASFGGKETDEQPITVAHPQANKDIKEPFVMIAEILPYFAVSDNLKVFLAAGLRMTAHTDASKDAFKLAYNKDLKSTVGWHVNPYVEISTGGPASFYAGIDLRTAGKTPAIQQAKAAEDNDPMGTKSKDQTKSVLYFKVPIAISISF
jgi:hypothetical protein